MATARIRARLLPHALASDPDLANLRLAARVAVVQPLVFAFGLLVLHNAQMTLFAAFAVFGLLVLANFGGWASQPAHCLPRYDAGGRSAGGDWNRRFTESLDGGAHGAAGRLLYRVRGGLRRLCGGIAGPASDGVRTGGFGCGSSQRRP